MSVPGFVDNRRVATREFFSQFIARAQQITGPGAGAVIVRSDYSTIVRTVFVPVNVLSRFSRIQSWTRKLGRSRNRYSGRSTN
jgi:hypothetical protein